MAGEFREDDHPRAKDGKFGSGSGAHERTEASLKDHAFVQQHMTRLIGAADRVREAAPHEERGTDAVHNAAQAAIHREASLIHHEDDAVSGPHKARLASALSEAREGSGGHEAIMSHLAATHKEAEEEHAAISAGHVNAEHPALAPVHEYLAARAEQKTKDDAFGAAGEDLLKANDHAAEAVAAFQATDALLEEHDEKHKPHEGELLDDLSNSANALDDTHNGYDASDYDRNDPEVREIESDADKEDAPKRDEFDSDDEFHAAKTEHEKATTDRAEHEKELSALRTEHEARASKAQGALEALHEKQHAALMAAKDTGKPLEKLKAKADRALEKLGDDDTGEALVNQAAFAGHKRFGDLEEGDPRLDSEDAGDDSQFVEPEIQAHHERARRVSESLIGRLSSDVEEDADGPDHSDKIDAIKEAAKSTAHAIKHLSKITGRPPKLAGVKTKKSNRPGNTSTASVSSMARYKLKLSKLDFLSLVDQPAQATATCRLIKRAGSRDAVQTQATAKFCGVTKDNRGPLAYFWAFTCTGDDGQPYHDLQGDAIAPDAYIKAAEDFMSGGGAVDDMHNGTQTSRVAFAFPMDSDIAGAMFGDAIGKQLKTSGLMVALRPTAEQLAKLQSGDYTGVSIAGAGIRELAKGKPPWLKKPGKKKPYAKSVVATSVEEGHAHTIDLCAPASCWSGSLSTSYQTSEGEEQSHTHAWTYDAAGVVTILPDSGHTHTVDGVVSAETMAEAAKDDDDDALPCAVEDKPSGPTVVVVSARAPAAVSTPSVETVTVKAQEQSMPTPEDKIAELEKRSARFEKMSSLTDAARAHFGKLHGSDADAFLSKSVTERDVVLAEIAKADEVVWESPIDGSKYRKSDDVRLINTAKALAESVAKQHAAETEAREATFAKRGEEVLKNFPAGAKKNLRGRLMKAVNAEFADPAEYEEAVVALKGMNNAFAELGVAKGVNPANDTADQSPAAQLAQLVKRHATENKVTEAAAYSAVLDTPEGARLYASAPVGRA